MRKHLTLKIFIIFTLLFTFSQGVPASNGKVIKSTGVNDGSSARAGLRRMLSVLKRTLGEGWLIVDRRTVRLKAQDDPSKGMHFWLDVAEFKRGTAQSPVSNLQLETAVSLYRGEFLEGFHVRQAPKFEAWVAQQRMMLQTALERSRRDVLAAGRDDDVLLPAGDPEEAVIIELSQVA